MSALVLMTILSRGPIACVWIYHGLWNKLLAADPSHRHIVQSLSGTSISSQQLVQLIGMSECALGVWVLTGWWVRCCAWTQTLLLATMNSAGLLYAFDHIDDPSLMIINNLTLLSAVWLGTLVCERQFHAR